MSDSEFPSWVLKGKDWNVCTFQDFGAKKQDYLNLLSERMAKNDFRQVEGIDSQSRWISFLNKKSDAIFESPDKKFRIYIQIMPKKRDLRVGFADTTTLTKNKIRLLIAFSILIAFLFGAISAYIISRSIDINQNREWIILPVIFILLGFCGPMTLISGIPKITWSRKIKKLLIETAESMGSKQIAPFKKTMYKLEE